MSDHYEEMRQRLDRLRSLTGSPSLPPLPPLIPERLNRASVPGRCHGNYCPICDGDGGSKVPAVPHTPAPSPLRARATATLPLPAAVETLKQNLREAEELVSELKALLDGWGL